MPAPSSRTPRPVASRNEVTLSADPSDRSIITLASTAPEGFAPTSKPRWFSLIVAAGTVHKLVQPDVAPAAVQQFALENRGNDDWSPGHRDHQWIRPARPLEGDRHGRPRRTADHARDLIDGKPTGGNVVDLHDAVELMDAHGLGRPAWNHGPDVESVIFWQQHDAHAGENVLAALALPPLGVLLGRKETGV